MAVDATGLTIKTTQEILADIETDQRADVDPAIITSSEEPVGQINGILADSTAQLWEALQIAYNAFNPDAVEGFLQDALGKLRGTLRKKATYSKVTVDLGLTLGTVLISGTHFAHVINRPDLRFTPLVDFTGTAGADSTVFRSEFQGPVPANAGTLTVIATPVSGWTTITNALDADLGRDEEKDDAYRISQEERLQASGSSTTGAIDSDVEGVENVQSVYVTENVTDFVDVNGLPGHSFEVLVYDPDGADNDEIAQAIYDSKPAGIQSYGTNASGTAIDDDGVTHVVPFSRAVAKNVWIDITTVPVVDAATLKNAIVTHMRAVTPVAGNVIVNEIIYAALTVAGVTDVTLVQLGFSALPGASINLSVGTREIADFDTSRIVII